MADLEIRNLRKEFGDEGEVIVAVDDITLEIDDGEFVILVGPSGCGKSTTLRCIAGLETPTSGELLLAGEDLVDKKPSNRDIAMVFQNYALYPHMTAFGNMAFGLKMGTDLPDDEIRQRVEEAAALLEIEDLLEDLPGELSGGQQQRVALGRAIVREPEVFLLDEPLSNLDAKLRSSMRAELQELQNALNVTTIYVTHDQTEAMTMADRIAILNGGQLQQFGTPLECYYHPENRFVAGFIGSPSMNFFEMGFEGRTLTNGMFDYTIPDRYDELVAGVDGQLTLGIRPEDILIGDGSGENEFDATVNVVEPMGERTVLYATINGAELVISTPAERVFEEGETIRIQFPPEKVHLFDGETGATIRDYSSDAVLSELQ